MNRVLFEADECQAGDVLTLSDHRFQHLTRILKVGLGDRIRIGMINGRAGCGEVINLTEAAVSLRLTLTECALPRHPVMLILALPRPKMLRRVLRTCAEFGGSHIHLINSARVEKSFWQSPLLQPDKVRSAMLKGLERSGDTVLPEWHLHRRFRPFMEDCLPGLAGDRPIAMAHPSGETDLGGLPSGECVLMVGPEGGFVPFEVDLAQQAGAQLVTLGRRVLSVDTAVPAALGITATRALR